MKIFKVKVVNVSRPTLWYANKVGQEFYVHHVGGSTEYFRFISSADKELGNTACQSLYFLIRDVDVLESFEGRLETVSYTKVIRYPVPEKDSQDPYTKVAIGQPPEKESNTDLEDAARHRWLRSKITRQAIFENIIRSLEESFDSVVDRLRKE